MKTMHAFTAPEAIAPLPRAYRRLNYPRSARAADAIIINSQSLRSEIEQYLNVDPRKLKLIYEAVDHDLFKPGDAGAARARSRRTASRSRSCCSCPRCGRTRTATDCCGRGRSPARELGDRQLAIVGARTRREVRRRAALARGRARHLRRRGLRRRGSARGDRPLLPGGRRLRVPVAQRDLRAPDPRGHGLRLPGRDLGHQRHAGDRGRSRGPGRSQGSGVHRPGHRRGGRAAGTACATTGSGGPASSPGRRRPRRPSTCTARSPSAGTGDGHEDPGHRRRRVHRIAHLRPAARARARRRRARRADPAGTPERAARVPEPRGRLLPGRHPQPRPAHEPAAPRRRRLPLRRLPGLPARLLAVLRRERGLDGPALRDHRGRAPRPGPGGGGVVAVGDGRGALPVPGRRRADAGHAPGEARSPRASGTSPARCAAARWRCRPRPSGSRIRRTRTACRSSARRWSPSTWAAGTASRPSRCATASSRGRGSRSTTPTRARAASSA